MGKPVCPDPVSHSHSLSLSLRLARERDHRLHHAQERSQLHADTLSGQMHVRSREETARLGHRQDRHVDTEYSSLAHDPGQHRPRRRTTSTRLESHPQHSFHLESTGHLRHTRATCRHARRELQTVQRREVHHHREERPLSNTDIAEFSFTAHLVMNILCFSFSSSSLLNFEWIARRVGYFPFRWVNVVENR